MTASRTKPPKPKAGVCRVCGCTEDRACHAGCSWTDKARTLCSACAAWEARSRPIRGMICVYGLQIRDLGPFQRLHWIAETIDPRDHTRTIAAIFYDRDAAEEAASGERDAGLDVEVARLIDDGSLPERHKGRGARR